MKDLIFEGVVDKSRIDEISLMICTINKEPVLIGEGIETLFYASGSLFARSVDYVRDGILYKAVVYLQYSPEQTIYIKSEAGEMVSIYDITDFNEVLKGLEGREV